jgi:methanol--5-hydroxybenzimidazolylcobamide Co-methyltransferase
VLRMTPNDNREFVRPPVMRSGSYWQQMLELFERSAESGAELLSIESVGGKEIHDEALQLGDLGQVIFALCVMGGRDMRFLWTKLAEIAGRFGVHAAGDTACGFANTAMVLAEQKMIPGVFAAVVRAISAVRSLIAYECGAVGPGKDCGYENIILKAVTGLPMACEGKSAACAHLSPIGNVAAAGADTWSNESVQNIKLLGGMAPTCMLESLIYDCRLMNQSLADGQDAARQLQRWLVRSDAPLDPQAYILTPSSAVRLARRIVQSPDDYTAGRAVALEAIDLLEEGAAAGELMIAERERPWLAIMRQSVEALPDDEDAFIERTMSSLDPTRYKPIEYDLQLTLC